MPFTALFLSLPKQSQVLCVAELHGRCLILKMHNSMTEPLQEKRRKMGAFGLWALATTIVPGFSVLGFRALNASNQILFYNID